MCVLLMHSSRGRLKTMCGSRTGGWSLPGAGAGCGLTSVGAGEEQM
jgi:hypothetical protein